MNKSKLRDELFNKYFENEEGVKLSDLVQILSPLTEKGKQLQKILFENIQGVYPFNPIYNIKCVEHDNNKYLLIRCGIWRYIVIDMIEQKTLDKVDVNIAFDEESFISYIIDDEETKEDIRNNGYDTQQFLPCKKDI